MQTRKPTKNTAILDAMAAELRRAVPADAVAVQELTRKAYAQWTPVIGREPMPIKADYDAALREHLVDLLYVEGRLCGIDRDNPPGRSSADRERGGLAGLARMWPGPPAHGARRSVGNVPRASRDAALHEQAIRDERSALSRARLPGGSRGALHGRDHGLYEQTTRPIAPDAGTTQDRRERLP